MRVKIDEITDKGLDLIFEERADSFPSLADIERSGECAFLQPLGVRLQMRPVGQLFEAAGRFESRVRLTCSRCLVEYETPLAADFSLTFIRQVSEADEPSRNEEIELRADEIGLILFYGDEIDLRDPIQEEVVMALPMRPLCRPDCKGLCPKCGADLNQGDCGCERKVFNPKFAALAGLKIVKK